MTVRFKHAKSRFGLLLLVAVVISHEVSGVYSADLFGRNAASGDWSTDANWVDGSGGTGTVPGASDGVYIGSAGYPFVSSLGTAAVDITGAEQASTIYIGYQAGDDGTLNILSGGSLSAGTIYVGNGGTGTLNLGGNTISVTSFYQGVGGSVSHGGGGISGSDFSIDGGSFSLEGTDSFSSHGIVSSGAAMTTSVPLALSSYLDVSGTGTSFVANDTVSVGTMLHVRSDAAMSISAALSAGSVLVYTGGQLTTSATLTTSGLHGVQIENGSVLDAGGDVDATASPYGVNVSGTLNLNGHTISTAYLGLGWSIYGSGVATLDRGAGGTVETASLGLSNGSSFTYQGTDSISDSVDVSGSSFALDKDLTLTSYLSVNNSTLDLNGHAVTLGGTFTLADGSTLNRGAGGTISGAGFNIDGGSTSYAYDGADSFNTIGMVSGGATVTTSAPLVLSWYLDISGTGTSFVANDTVSVSLLSVYGNATATANTTLSAGSVLVHTGGQLTTSAALTVSGLYGMQIGAGSVLDAGGDLDATGSSAGVGVSGTLNLNGHTLSTSSLSLGWSIYGGGVATLDRGAGGTVEAASLGLSNGSSFTYQGTDSITDSVEVSGSSFALDKDLTLTSYLSVNNSTLDLNGHTVTLGGALQLIDGSTFIRGAGGAIHGTGFYIDGNTSYAYDGIDSFDTSGYVSDGATVTTSAPLVLSSHLHISGTGTSFLANDTVSVGTLNLSSGGTLVVTQLTGGLSGLALNGVSDGNFFIDGTSLISLIFDGEQSPGALDWAFRWSGDHVAILTSLLGNQILASGAPHAVSIIRDVDLYGDFTYVGFISPIPEPGSLLLASIGVLASLRRRSRKVDR